MWYSPFFFLLTKRPVEERSERYQSKFSLKKHNEEAAPPMKILFAFKSTACENLSRMELTAAGSEVSALINASSRKGNLCCPQKITYRGIPCRLNLTI